jgi:hypothetical protein
VAHARFGRVIAAWDAPNEGSALTQSPVDPGYRGPRVPRGAELGNTLWRAIADRFLASFPETVMLIFFGLFVFFSIVWALQIL